MNKTPVFLCYRQADGLECANLVYEIIHGEETSIVANTNSAEPTDSSELDVYFDQTAAAVGNWQTLHEPHLKRARAMIVICSPGVAYRDPHEDWVHKEIDWWLENRPEIAPILIESTSSSGRFIPQNISKAWPDIQRLTLDADRLEKMSKSDQEQTLHRLKERILKGIVPSSENFYLSELLKERQRVAELEQAISLQQDREREILSLTWLYELTKDHASREFSGVKHHQSYLTPLLSNSPNLVAEKMDAALEKISMQGVPLDKGELLDLLGSKGFFRLILDLFSKKNAYARILFIAGFLDPLMYFTHEQLSLLNIILKIIDGENTPKVLSRYGTTKSVGFDDGQYVDIIFDSLALCSSEILASSWPSDDLDIFFALSKPSPESTPAHTILDCTSSLMYRARSFAKGELSSLFSTESEFETAFFQAHFRPMILAGLALQAEFIKHGKTNEQRYKRLRETYSALSCIKLDYVDNPIVLGVASRFNDIPSPLRLKAYADLLYETGQTDAATSLINLNDSLASQFD